MPEVSQLVEQSLDQLVRATLESQPEFMSARGLKKKLCDVLYREFRDQKNPISLAEVIEVLKTIQSEGKDLANIKLPQINQLLEELEMAKSLTVPGLVIIGDKDQLLYQDAPKTGLFTTKKVIDPNQKWDQGAWLLCVADQHPLQWAIRTNLEIEKSSSKDSRRSSILPNSITVNGKDPFLHANQLAEDGKVSFRTSEEGLKLSVVDWATIQRAAVFDDLPLAEVKSRESKVFEEMLIKDAIAKIKITKPITPDDFKADVRKLIIKSLAGYSEDGKVKRSENISQRVLSDLADLQKVVKSLSPEDQKKLSDSLVGSTLSPGFIFEIFDEVTRGGIQGLYADKRSDDPSKYQESTQFLGGRDDPKPLIEALEVAKTSILPRMMRGSNKYHNWLGNLLQLVNLAVDHDPESAPKSRQAEGLELLGRGIKALKSTLGLSDSLKQEEITGSLLVQSYVDQQEGFKRKRSNSNFEVSESINQGVETEVSKILAGLEAKQESPWSASEIKAELCAGLYKKVARGEDVSPKDVYGACKKYFDETKDSKIKDQLGLLLDELQIIASLTSLDHHEIEIDSGGAKIMKPWQQGPWLKDLKTKHVLQWGLEYNDKLARDHDKGERKEEGYVQIDFSLLDKSAPNVKQDLLLYADATEVGFLDEKGMSQSALRWAIGNNFRVNDSQTAKDMAMFSKVLAKERFAVFKDAVGHADDEEIGEYIKEAIRHPHIVDCHRAAHYLAVKDSRYKEILDAQTISDLCDRTASTLGIVLDSKAARNLENLFKAVEGNDARIKGLQAELKELLYEKSKNLQAQIEEKQLVGEDIKDLELNLRRCDQLYDLFSSPSFLDKDRKDTGIHQDCRLLGEDSKLAKLFKEHSAKDIAIQFDRNREYKKPFADKVWGGLKIVAGAVIGAGVGGIAGQATGVGSTVGKVAGAVVGAGATYTAGSIDDFCKKVDEGTIKFGVSEQSSCQLTCSAELRRNIDKVTDIVAQRQKEADNKWWVRWGRRFETFFNNVSSDNKKLSNEIKAADSEMNEHAIALQAKDSMAWLEIAEKFRTSAKDFGKGFGIKISGAFITASAGAAGFYEGTMEGIKSSWNAFNNSCDVAVTKVDNTKSEVSKDPEPQPKKSWTERFFKAKSPKVTAKKDQSSQSTSDDGNTSSESEWKKRVRQDSGADPEQSWVETVDSDHKEPDWVKTGGAKLAEQAAQRRAEMMNKGAKDKKNGWRLKAQDQESSEGPTRTQ